MLVDVLLCFVGRSLGGGVCFFFPYDVTFLLFLLFRFSVVSVVPDDVTVLLFGMFLLFRLLLLLLVDVTVFPLSCGLLPLFVQVMVFSCLIVSGLSGLITGSICFEFCFQILSSWIK